MAHDADAQNRALEGYRDYLHLLARLHVPPQMQGKLDVSGVIQTTLLEAHQAHGQLRGQGEAQVAAWLRKILVHNLADELRRQTAGKRDVGRERSLEAALQDSSARLEAFLAAQQPSPSQQVMRREQVFRLAQALAALPENQRRAVELHHLKGLPLAEIARALGCTKPAVAGLLHRGLKGLRERLTETDEG